MSVVHQQSGTRRRARVVLVVDDDRACRETVCDTLSDAGYVALEASDGAEALDMLLADGAPVPDAIVLDVQMPRMTGPELVVALKQSDRLGRVPVILTSAGPRHAMADVDAELTWLPKPFDAERLLVLMNDACNVQPPSAENGTE